MKSITNKNFTKLKSTKTQLNVTTIFIINAFNKLQKN